MWNERREAVRPRGSFFGPRKGSSCYAILAMGLFLSVASMVMDIRTETMYLQTLVRRNLSIDSATRHDGSELDVNIDERLNDEHNDSNDTNSGADDDYRSFYIPRYPDFTVINNLRRSIRNSTVDPLQNCFPTMQMRLLVPKKSNLVGKSKPWIIEALGPRGERKTFGGDEFYVSYYHYAEPDLRFMSILPDRSSPIKLKPTPFRGDVHAPKGNKTEVFLKDTTEYDAIQPTAVAFVQDNQDGTYTLDFSTTPMFPVLEFQEVTFDRAFGRLTIDLMYTCGMGMLSPPMKEAWYDGGQILRSYSIPVSPLTATNTASERPSFDLLQDSDMILPPPSIRKFENPPRPLNFDDYDRLVFVGDSLMRQFALHHRVTYRDNIRALRNTNRPLLNETWETIYNMSIKMVTQTIQEYEQDSPNNRTEDGSNRKFLLLLGSSAWDLLSNQPERGPGFADHLLSIERLIDAIRKEIPRILKQHNVALDVAWKSPTAFHVNAIETRQEGEISRKRVFTERIKYMSEGRSRKLYEEQLSLMKRLQVPFIDLYNSSFLSGNWHHPKDGRHYVPILNHMWINTQSSDVRLYRKEMDYSGVGTY